MRGMRFYDSAFGLMIRQGAALFGNESANPSPLSRIKLSEMKRRRRS